MAPLHGTSRVSGKASEPLCHGLGRTAQGTGFEADAAAVAARKIDFRAGVAAGEAPEPDRAGPAGFRTGPAAKSLHTQTIALEPLEGSRNSADILRRHLVWNPLQMKASLNRHALSWRRL